jgi:hypothetical protein
MNYFEHTLEEIEKTANEIAQFIELKRYPVHIVSSALTAMFQRTLIFHMRESDKPHKFLQDMLHEIQTHCVREFKDHK